MKTLDILMVIPLAWGAYNGYRKGLLIEIVAIIAFVVAMIVGFKFLGFGIDLLAPYISRELARKILPWLGFSVIFFPTVFMINQFGYSLRKSMRFTLLGTFDSLAGATVGIFTWLFGISVLLWLFSFMGVKMPLKHTQGALLYPYIVPIAPRVMDRAAVWVPAPVAGHKKRLNYGMIEGLNGFVYASIRSLYHSTTLSVNDRQTGYSQADRRAGQRLAHAAGRAGLPGQTDSRMALEKVGAVVC